MLLLVPSNPLRPRAPDPHFADEFRAARDLGAQAAVVDHDLLESGSAAAAVRALPESQDVVYRGWMLRSEQYAELDRALAANGSRLRTSAAQYRAGHELPGWAAALAGLTPNSIWSAGPDLAGLEQLRSTWGGGRAVLRDHTKSMKHFWDEAMYLPDLADPAAVRRVGARFLELREDTFSGGFVVRRFEEFTGDEVRTWWVDGSCVLTTAHPDTPGKPPEVDLSPFAPAIARLSLPFVSVDLARRADGGWRIVELGDGQVSDRPRDVPAAHLIAALLRP